MNPCTNRNIDPAYICPYDNVLNDNYAPDTYVDFKYNDVNPITMINTFRGRFDRYNSWAKKLRFTKNDHLIFFTTGHGGDGYTKIKELKFIMSWEYKKAISEMEKLEKYQKLLIITDSCGAFT